MNRCKLAHPKLNSVYAEEVLEYFSLYTNGHLISNRKGPTTTGGHPSVFISIFPWPRHQTCRSLHGPLLQDQSSNYSSLMAMEKHWDEKKPATCKGKGKNTSPPLLNQNIRHSKSEKNFMHWANQTLNTAMPSSK